MSSRPPQVDVFHFTNRISTAKIRKYKLATERGMAPGSGSAMAIANGRANKATSEQSNGMSESPTQTPTPATESSPDDQPPPAKKPRLKLKVRAQKKTENENAGDTIAVSRTRREAKPTRRSLDEQPEPEPVATRQSQPSPAPSSDLSSLSSAPSSAPPSERAESPFVDPEPVEEGEYGDLLSYYVVGGGGPVAKPKTTKATTASKRKEKAESAKKAPPAHVQVEKSIESPRDPAPQPVQSRAPQFPVQQHTHQHSLPITSQNQHLAQPNQAPPQGGTPQIPPPYPRAPPVNQRPPPPPRPVAMPQPVVNFIDIVHDPKPMQPDTILVMIRKLENLSSALTNFGGVPAMPHTPPSEQPPKAKPPKAAKPHKPAESGSKAPGDEVDTFLSIFDDGEDEEDEDDESIEEETRDPLDRTLPQPGMVDNPLSFGIQFIQNALKSWAQQRINHQVTQQFQAQHQQQMHQQQMQPVKRGPGRPRRYDDSAQQQTLGPIIHFDMANTPEGMAIKSFQSVLDSGCLQVNGILPVELSRALRRLYMQIDHLINQGVKDNTNWQCMSYGAQINAHKVRIEKLKEANAKAEEEMLRQREQNAMRPPMTEAQGQQAHTVELERRRSGQQYHSAQQHPNPMQLPSQPPPQGMATSRSPSAVRHIPQPTVVTSMSPAMHNTPSAGHEGQGRPGSEPLKGDAGSPIEIDVDEAAGDQSKTPQTTAPAVHTSRPVTGGFTAVNAPPPPSQVRNNSVQVEMPDTPSPETIKVAQKYPSGYASGSASPAMTQGNVMPGQGVMSRSNFPHPGAVVIDQ